MLLSFKALLKGKQSKVIFSPSGFTSIYVYVNVGIYNHVMWNTQLGLCINHEPSGPTFFLKEEKTRDWITDYNWNKFSSTLVLILYLLDITLFQAIVIYMLKVEVLYSNFLPDTVQLKNATKVSVYYDSYTEPVLCVYHSKLKSIF